MAFQLSVEGTKQLIDCQYVVSADGVLGFSLGEYDETRPLRIDPTLLTSTFWGGSFSDRIDDLAHDDSGNILVTGYTGSDDFPVLGGVQPTRGGSWDLFVAKLDPTAQTVLYSTYLGGTGTDWEPSLAVDAAGSAYVTARSNSTDYPTMNPLQASNAGDYDLVVSKLSPDGSNLVYSTYLGGSGTERFLTFRVTEVGNDGRLNVAGFTNSNDYPVVNPYQSSRIDSTCLHPGGLEYACHDLVISVFSADGSSLVYSTYFGSSGDDVSPHLAVDSAGDLYLGFFTSATDLPTVLAPQKENAGSSDMYVAKLRPDGSPPLFSSYWGGSGPDGVFDIEVDPQGRVYLAGWAGGSDFPEVEPIQSYQPGICGAEPDTFPCRDMALVRFNPRGTAVEFSSALGGSGYETATSLRIDEVGGVLLGGLATASDFPVVDPIQATRQGPDHLEDGVLALLRGTGRPEVLMATYLGGEALDWIFGLDIDHKGVVTLGGNTDSEDFPITAALQADYAGHGLGGIVAEGFISRISPDKAVLALEQKVSAILGEPVELQISISPGGLEISSLVFSVDLPDCLSFDDSDSDLDLMPDAISLDVPSGYSASVSVDFGDVDGEIDFLILDPAPPLAGLATSFLGSITVTPTCLPAAGGFEISLPFSESPEISFGTVEGTSAPGFGIAGSVEVFAGDRGDCNGDGSIDAGDLSACVLEVFDDDGTFWLDTAGSTFSGTPLGCDANGDTLVDAGDLACKQLLVFQGPGACDAQTLARESSFSQLRLEGPESGVVGEPIRVAVYLETGGASVRSIIFSLDLGPGLVLPPGDVNGDGLPDVLLPHLPEGFAMAVDSNPDRSFAELAFAILPPADLEEVVTSGLLFELDLQAVTPSLETGLRPSRQMPFSLGNIQGRSISGEVIGLDISIASFGELFSDGFESGDVKHWSVSVP